jgi:(p)ppGpp synthase/HD superfamily hydrolase
MNLYDKAKVFSMAAHEAIGQKRKYTGEPYYFHPQRVADILQDVQYTLPEEAYAVALLHDVVEDTQVDLHTIGEVFGAKVEQGVALLTDMPTVEGGPNRKKRKELDRLRLSQAPAWVQTIKVADMIDNTSTIVEYDPKFAKIYLEEKRLMVQVLTQADPILLERAQQQIKE